MHYHYINKLKPHPNCHSNKLHFFNGIFTFFQHIGFSDRMSGQYRREKDLQQHSNGLVQYTVLAIPAENAHDHETNSSQRGSFPGQTLVQTPAFSDHQTSN
jgi:hypothetical protein